MANAEGDGGESKETECDSESEGNGVVRRPMNAFLIFCKRHRSLVREKYPHMENRSITKILGEWWANLEANEKVTYTDLAKQYKEAFMKANPDFRWYKLPAPTSRTLVTRPSNQRSSKVDFTATANFSGANKCGITPGKLADETQLGGLNFLITQPCSSSSSSSSSTSSSILSKPPKKRYLHNGAFVNNEVSYVSNSDQQTSNACSALLELASICSSKGSIENYEGKDKLSNDDDTKEFFRNEKETTVSNQQLINCIIENSIGSSQDTVRLNGASSKLFGNELQSKFDGKKYDDEFEFVNKNESGICRKSERKGKGKRYQALLSEGILQPPKDRRHMTNYTKKMTGEERGNFEANSEETKSLNLDSQIAALPHCSFEALIKKKRKSDNFDGNDDRLHKDNDFAKDGDSKGSEGSSDGDINSSYIDENEGKARFQSGGFDLEKEIAALPSLNIDLLNQRKKQQRHKSLTAGISKIQNKNKGNHSPEDESNCFDTRPTLVGSQKRKARKRSITHLDPTCEHKPHISVVEPILLTTLSTVARPNE